MHLLIAIFAVLFGLVFGSFLNVCIYRLPLHQSVVRPRSRCPRCEAAIRNRDNVPILSWLLLRGRCHDCGAPIPFRYPMVEVATAALFLLCYFRFDISVRGIGSALLCWLLLGLAAMDAETLLLPDAFTLPGIVLGVVYSGLSAAYLFDWKASGTSLLWAVAAGGFLWLVRVAYWLIRRREGMGLGDAKLLAMIAAWLGPLPTLLVLFLGVVAAAIYGLAGIAVHKFRNRSGPSTSIRLPLGAFLCAAGIFVVFAGEDILYWYMKLIR